MKETRRMVFHGGRWCDLHASAAMAWEPEYLRTCINENPGCLFITTNRDPTRHMTSAQEWFERFDWKCNYTRVKILGTLMCLSGAMCVSFLKNPTPSVSIFRGVEELSNGKGRQDWMLGCFYLLTVIIIFSCNTVLQAAALKRFPAPLSICSITAMMGVIFTAKMGS